MFHFLCSFLSLAGPQTAPCFLAVLFRPRGVVLTSRASLHVTCLFGRFPPPTCVDPRLSPGKSFLPERFWRSLTFITTNSITLVKSLQFQGQHHRCGVGPDVKNGGSPPLDLADITWHLCTILFHLTCNLQMISWKESGEPSSRILMKSHFRLTSERSHLSISWFQTWSIFCIFWLTWSVQNDKSGMRSVSALRLPFNRVYGWGAQKRSRFATALRNEGRFQHLLASGEVWDASAARSTPSTQQKPASGSIKKCRGGRITFLRRCFGFMASGLFPLQSWEHVSCRQCHSPVIEHVVKGSVYRCSLRHSIPSHDLWQPHKGAIYHTLRGSTGQGYTVCVRLYRSCMLITSGDSRDTWENLYAHRGGYRPIKRAGDGLLLPC